ncbi:MAG: T9SS type A sorting domain-containing protein [Cytophagaceae bacterium]
MEIGATAGNPTGFSVGDKILIIQMKGADIDVSNTASFGNINSIANAGNYEINEISDITGSVIQMKFSFLKTYTPVGKVQLIRIPQYTNVSVDAMLTALPWNGTVGGVLIFEASGRVTLNANINVSGIGFRGGLCSQNNSSYGCSNTTSALTTSNLFYYSWPSFQAGYKGEGAAEYVATREAGKGKQLNGGGGGNGHNSGGAGGGNYGQGGRGGDKGGNCANSFFPNGPGINGFGFGNVYYTPAVNRIFMGGGGGGGQQNNDKCNNGGNGGGIVIIKANEIEGNGYGILSVGNSVAENTDDHGDGNGGAGAGGTVLIHAASILNSLNVNVSGGAGGSTNNFGSDFDFGPGGGGGGGLLWTSGAMANLSTVVTGGVPGNSRKCNCPHNATSGAVGAVLTNLSLATATSPFVPPCMATPVNLVSFEAVKKGDSVVLKWITAGEKDNKEFLIERSEDGSSFSPIGKVNGGGNLSSVMTYLYEDNNPVGGINYYRLIQVDLSGKLTFLGVVTVGLEDAKFLEVYPNPFTDYIEIKTTAPLEKINLTLSDLAGKVYVNEEKEMLNCKALVQLRDIEAGVYILTIETDQGRSLHKIIKW